MKIKIYGIGWMLVAVGLIINICIGAIDATQSGLPFMVFLRCFALAMPLAGNLMQKWGPKKTTML
ncbi:MAG: hypothetical protein BWK75_04245 [Candidatus Altiarchaeales archaeon A3]|nr:MAG: hypothetical protein BWK75_04245 [Candidatus Altiarchaeales archaeon A3]